MGQRLSPVDLEESTEQTPREVPRSRTSPSRSIAARAEMELRRNARAGNGEAAHFRADSNQQTVARLVGRPGAKAKHREEHSQGDKPQSTSFTKAATTAGAVALAGGAFAVGGVADVLAVAIQPIFLGTGVAAAVATYLGGELISTIRTNSRLKMSVEQIEVVRPGLVAAHIQGESLESLPIAAGQCAEWRFVAKDNSTVAIDGFLSCIPRDGVMRVMFVAGEEATEALRGIAKGARVTVRSPSGPSPDAVTGKSLVIAGGAGILPARGLFESLPGEQGDVTLMYRAIRPSELVFMDEIKEIGAHRKAKVNVIVGAPSSFPPNKVPLCAAHLKAATPDIEQRDVFVFGPARMVSSVTTNLRRLGVPEEQIHAAKV